MASWLAENPQAKHGRHRYSLAEFGIDRDAEESRFAAYRSRFRVPTEP